MNRHVSLFLMGVLCCISSASAVAQTTAINGHINGIEVCAQSLEICRGYASFVGTFVGKINGNDTTAAFAVRVKHESLNETNQGVTMVMDGDWMIVLDANTAITGTVAGGTLTFRPNNTFAVDLTLPITQGGTATFDGTLNHNVFPPTITGRLRSK
ncbi:MAG TPA: hypothetical protein VFR60_06090 [Sphingomicrobium sp.]|nr:hypothetical protein [Sphingomicrobium sp.]